ncbi:tetratricopeptide repeat protein [Winogradskyella sp.]|uniref:tetratricopeptide repeat protein n=1 Tax=Winogradskyella sp. TaxID=1883156 RepID=UPI003F6BD9E0
MKKLIALVLLVAFTSISFAQKSEIKAIEKALKKSNFADARTSVTAAEALLGNMDDKAKAKFYFLKAQSLYANGAGTDAQVDEAIESLDKLKTLESQMGKLKYTDEANEMKSSMFNSFIEKANQAFNNNDFVTAAKRFEKIYRVSPKDTLYLYNAAYSAVEAQDYDMAIDYFLKLKELGYTGIKTNYYAVNKETNQEEKFADKAGRDFSVKIKTHLKPRDEKAESKRGEIVRNIALIYVSQGENEKALAAMVDAREENPDDLGLIIAQAQMYLKMGNKEMFAELIDEASSKGTDDAEFLFNLGTLLAESENHAEAKKYYQNAIDKDPTYNYAYINMAFSILADEANIVKEMNGLGNSAADNKRYDELKEKRENLYREAIPYFEKSLTLKDDINVITNLMNLYSVLGETDKYKELKAKKEQMEAAAGGN